MISSSFGKAGADFVFRELELPEGSSLERVRGREGLLRDLVRGARPGAASDMTTYQARALDLLTSAATRRGAWTH